MTASYRPRAEMVGLYTLDRFLKRTRGIINELLNSLTIMAPKCQPDDQLLLENFWRGSATKCFSGSVQDTVPQCSIASSSLWAMELRGCPQ